jgi:hypothetical protein
MNSIKSGVLIDTGLNSFFFSSPSLPLWSIGLISQFHSPFLQCIGLLWRVISSSEGLHLTTGQHKHRINTYTYQTSKPCVGFEPTIPASERTKTVHVLDRSATVTGLNAPITKYTSTTDTPLVICRFLGVITQVRNSVSHLNKNPV